MHARHCACNLSSPVSWQMVNDNQQHFYQHLLDNKTGPVNQYKAQSQQCTWLKLAISQIVQCQTLVFNKLTQQFKINQQKRRYPKLIHFTNISDFFKLRPIKGRVTSGFPK